MTNDHGHHHDKHAGHSPDMFRSKFWLSLFLSIPVVFWAAHIQELLGYTAPTFAGTAWIPPAFATFVFFYGEAYSSGPHRTNSGIASPG